MNYRAASLAVILTVITVVAGPAVFGARIPDRISDLSFGNRLSFRLVGTALAEYPSGSIAVIESGVDGRQRTYRVGDFVFGMRIKQILRNRVIVKTDSGERTITISRSQFSDVEPSVSRDNSAPIAFGPRPPQSRRRDTRYLDRESVVSALTKIDDIAQTASIEAVTVYGKPVGVKITPIEPGSIFSNIGLKTGDVILEVNGAKIAQPEEAIAIFRQLKKGDDVDIKVKGRRTRQIHLILE